MNVSHEYSHPEPEGLRNSGRSPRIRIACMVGCVVVATALGACSQREMPPSAETTLIEARRLVESDHSAAFDVHVDIDDLLDTNGSVDGSGVLRGEDWMVEGAAMNQTPSGSPASDSTRLEFRGLSGVTYRKWGNAQWERCEELDFLSLAVNPVAPLSLLEGARVADDAGQEDLDGVTCRHLVLEPELPSEDTRKVTAPMEGRQASQKPLVALDVWIRWDDNRLKRLAWTTGGLASTFDFHGWGGPVTIEAPES